jgi:hypothetical protein
MNTQAWVTLLEGLSSYSAIASSYLLARPFLHQASLRSAKDILDSLGIDSNAEIEILRSTLRTKAAAELAAQAPSNQKWNRWGIALMALSLILLTAAVGINAQSPD